MPWQRRPAWRDELERLERQRARLESVRNHGFAPGERVILTRREDDEDDQPHGAARVRNDWGAVRVRTVQYGAADPELRHSRDVVTDDGRSWDDVNITTLCKPISG